MLSTAAAIGSRLAVVSSWKLDSSSTNTSGQARPRAPVTMGSSTSSTALPMLPATIVARPAARHSAPVSAVTVVLPLEPVTASTFCSGGSARAKSSMSPTSSTPRAAAAAIAGSSLRTPGLIAIRSAPAKVAAVSAPVTIGHLRQRLPQRIGERRRAARIGDRDPRAARGEMAREREPGETESQHDRVASGVRGGHQRSFSVDRPNRTSSIVMIQKRTTTWFSFQPFNS